MDWFNYLKEQDFFNPENNPSPVQVTNGFQISSWEVLDYLISISSKFNDSENLELIPEILEVVKNISLHPVDNYHTWYKLIKILSLTPNKYVTDEFLDFIPVYVTSHFDTLLQTAEITDSLLPKFLISAKSSEDIEKAEKIISYLFEVRCSDNLVELDRIATVNYISPFYLYKLSHAFHDEQILAEIINVCSSKPLYHLLDQINILLRDDVIVAEANDDNINYYFKFYRVFKKMIFTLEKDFEGEKEIVHKTEFDNYWDFDKKWFDQFLTSIFEEYSIDKNIYDSTFDKLSFRMWNDFSSLMGYEGFSTLEQDPHYHNVTLGVFSYLLKEWLIGLIDANPEQLKNVLKDFVNKNEFNLPYFKRLLIYIVAQDWENLKFLFWGLIDYGDNSRIFSSFAYKLELYYLLSKVSERLNDQEQDLIYNILEKGPVGDKHYSSNKDEWKHRWLDALQKNDFFATKYRALEEKYSTNIDYLEEGKVVVRVGHVAPFTTDEILNMEIEDLILNIENFCNKGGWDNPTIDGFADVLRQAVEQEPERFSNFISKFLDAKYIYVYNILSAFSTAWKANKFFNWENVLNFCYKYITSESFLEDTMLSTNDDLRADKKWIFGTVSMLITDATQNEKHSISSELLPICKKILFRIFKELPDSGLNSKQNDDFIIYSLNSTEGQLLTAMLNYALKLARNRRSDNALKRWDDEIKSIFDKSFNEFVDSSVMLGKNIPQFMYLDESWLREKLLDLNNIDDVRWSAFMEGLVFGKPLNSEYYKLLYHSYQRAADLKLDIVKYNHGILRHFLAYYFWDYEANFEETLLYKILQNPNIEMLANIIQLLLKQKEIMKDESPNKEFLVGKILNVWRLINASLEHISSKEEHKLLERIVYLTEFIEKLNGENVVLIEQNLSKFHNDINSIHFIQALSNWTKNSSPELIGRLASKLSIRYVHDRQPIIELVAFLYENGQSPVADQIVNKLTMEGYDFLKPLYLRFN